MKGVAGALPWRAAAVGREATLSVCGISLLADHDGVLYWPEERLLVVADLHFEKGSSFARRGMLLPPYDTAATLARLTAVVARYAPRTVVALGDSFHDGGGPSRLAGSDRAAIAALQAGRDWIWITGNHDPEPSSEMLGTFAEQLMIGPLTLRHQPTGETGEIAGHLHPSARISWRGASVVRRCFAADSKCVVMPAFGAYTGGLSIRDRAFAAVFGACDFTAHLLGNRRIYAFPSAHCL
jgi:DNA ligase-associated metallophosphoesterase